MNQQSLVSVVTICYNGEQFLAEAIDSVVAQTYSNWELLLVDDGSSDRSVAIMQEYVEQYPDKVRYLQHPDRQNRGANASRNLGITNAKGEYIALLDCDDVWLPYKLERQVKLMAQHPEAGAVDGKLFFWHSWTGKAEDIEQDRLIPLPPEIKPNAVVYPPQLLLPLLNETYYGSNPSTPLWRRKVFERVGLFNDNFKCGMIDDLEFVARVHSSISILVCDEYWTKYRQCSDSLVKQTLSLFTKNILLKHKNYLYLYKSLRKYLSQHEIEFDEVRDFLNRRIFWLEKKIWLFGSSVWLSRIYNYTYHLWLEFIERSLSVGRLLLPFALRDWLWRKVGERLYFFLV